MNYAAYEDGTPISNKMRSMTTGRIWFRRSDGWWSDGTMSGAWSEVERTEGPFEERPLSGGPTTPP